MQNASHWTNTWPPKKAQEVMPLFNDTNAEAIMSRPQCIFNSFQNRVDDHTLTLKLDVQELYEEQFIELSNSPISFETFSNSSGDHNAMKTKNPCNKKTKQTKIASFQFKWKVDTKPNLFEPYKFHLVTTETIGKEEVLRREGAKKKRGRPKRNLN